MALPKIKHPTYKVKLTSLKKTVTIRPFTVQEEKLLLMASSSEDYTNIVDSIKQIITNCIVDDIDINKLASFDIEYLFMKLRAKSVSEVVKLIYTDPEEGKIEYEVNLDQIELKINPNHKTKFTVHDKIGVVMRYPNVDEIQKLSSIDMDNLSNDDSDKLFNMLISCVECVYDDNQIYDEFTKEEIQEFIYSLPMESLQKIQSFFETMPSLEYTKELTLPSGKKKTVELKGMTSFFM